MRIRNVLLSVLGGGVLAFGLYNVHSLSGVTEGGALGLTLLMQHWLGISPAWSGLVIDFGCYAFGLKTLGRGFLLWSAIGGGSFSAFYAVFEQFPRSGRSWRTIPFWRHSSVRSSWAWAVGSASGRAARPPGTMPWPWASAPGSGSPLSGCT